MRTLAAQAHDILQEVSSESTHVNVKGKKGP